MTSSLRAVPLPDTLAAAKDMAARLGIVRVTDTTWLDCLGIPVFASIRPGAARGSLCVNAGKGVHPDEARVGAYMEAIEFALAQYPNANVEEELSTPRGIAGQKAAEFEFVDLCPLLGRPVDPDGPLACVKAHDLASGAELLVPAELVFHPYAQNPAQSVFGTTTNGLASGNTVAEATLHGLCEVVERDVKSFNYFRDRSEYVDLDGAAPDLAQLRERLEQAGLRWGLRHTPNDFGLPFFEGFILDEDDHAPITIAEGAGLHPLKEIAAVRALAEAAQSRLSFIHGGRDDVIDRFHYFADRGEEAERSATAQVRERLTDRSRSVPYTAVGEQAVGGIADALRVLLAALERNGMRQVLRVVLSGPDSPLAVVKVVVPRLEHFDPRQRRLGPRLARFAETAGVL
ncbi:YcaO-like family protein [Actinomadura rupiterrae]|uniref:YcaO-like family protein n=1 Tax=Actinomadura rupiterrae TaxID=559627 RepID=UPI0020A5B42E|nr:YcaO-like family protein [Actinomadura rupiterrae]MCP2342598.1 ribosomal protein S12 methylthiotransferase accessory factor [Actinomadura rupiterrae]